MQSDHSTRGRSIVACIAATLTMSVTLGLCWPLLAIVLERQGVPTWLNGLSASAQMVAILAVMPIAPALIGALGVVRVIAIGIIAMVCGLALLPVFPNVWAWFPIRFGLGLGAELVFIGGDIWINQLAEERTRGRLIGVYGMFLHGGFAVGPVAIIALGSDDWTVLYVSMAVIVSGLIPLMAAMGSAPATEEKPRARLRHYVRVATTLMLAGLMFGLIDSSVVSLLPVYGLEKGLDDESAAFLLTLFVSGAVLGQLPVGWLADRVEHRRLLMAASLTALVSLATLPWVIERSLVVWPIMLTLGASLGSFYIVAMTMMGRRYRGADLIGVNTSFVFIWGVGAAVGPALSGSSMDLLGPDGMPLLGGGLCFGFLLLCLRAPMEEVRAPNSESRHT
jgi:MFS family permease